MRTWASPAPRRPGAAGSRSWPPRSAWDRSGSCCRWSAHGWPATTPCSDIGTRRFVPRTDLCRVGTRSSCRVGDGRMPSRNKSEALQEGKEYVWCPVAAGGGASRGGARQRSLFEREIGVQVDAVGGFNLLVTEPERDNCDVDPALQQSHRACVPENVRRHVFGVK